MVVFRCILFSCFYLFSFSLSQAKALKSDQDGDVKLVPFNIFLKDNDDLKVDLDISEDDYSLISKHITKDLEIMNEDKIFKEFNQIASQEYEKVMAKHRNESQAEAKSKIILKEFNNRTTSIITSSAHKINTTRPKVEYNYLVSEYCGTATGNDAMTNTYDPVDIRQPEYELVDSLTKIISFNTSDNCTKQDLEGIGIQAIKCLIAEFYVRQQDYKALAQNLWKISAIWTTVYLMIAIPLWCTQGWCSCCLCCKFFKPQQTIQEAKNYLLLNPPGILVTKNGGIINYEPTERERDCHEEFGHFLRTL